MYPIQNYVQTSMENCLLKAFRKIENEETMEKAYFLSYVLPQMILSFSLTFLKILDWC